ncbi:MAG: TonB-dependent receptor [Bacteroidetes bacterium]|uniref:TonB-dependent receptor n=1 Tax=Candidatus Cryptobacteroides intestinigallinarum TaxID=2840767 RepID=A0A9D9HJ90_9BACT|nr:TonB-dependent receptor [Candidatus Cryptobacteroides intestinigallinarum]
MKNLKYKISLLVAGLFATLSLSAQEYSGAVKDAGGQPLAGVSVFVEGTTLGVSTDADGKYVINVPDAKGKTLVFSCIGMRSHSVVIGNSKRIDVVLEEDANFLEETVVIGYATVKRKDLMGSVSSVDSKALTAVPVTTVGEALSGRMAGVQVTTTEGDPDADIKIRVRGSGSITQDSSPLYIVDGFPVESISDIAASDIQSIDVLKDAFSTAIYGSRGANGVVLVTTKGGTSGKFSVSYNAYWGMKKMANADAIKVGTPYDFAKNQYELSMIRGSYEDDYVPYFGVFDDIDLYQNVQGNDWVQQVFGNTGTNFSQNVSVSGSTDKVRWTASYSHIGDNAIMVGSTYKRDNLNFKANYKPIKQLEFDVNARYSHTKIMGSGSNSMNDAGSTSGNGRLKHAVQYMPIPVAEGAVSGSDLEEDYGDNAPPLQSVADNDNRRVRRNWTVNGAVTWHILKNLNLRVEGGLEDYTQENDRFYGMTTYYVGNTAQYPDHPATRYTDLYRQTIRNTNTLSYNFKELFKNDRHHLDILLGQEYIVKKSNELTAVVENFPDFFTSEMAWNFMSTGTSVSTNNYYDPNDKLLSFFGRVNYVYDDRYSVSATMRADGSSKFTKGNQWGYFPSAAVSWTLSNEPWMKGASKWLNNLKLRYSYGTAGNNNIPSGMTMLNFASFSTSWISQSDTYWSTVTDGGDTIMPNEDLSWETTISHNIGLDFAFFNSRLTGSFELYHNTTKDLLIQFPTAGSGYEFQYRNMGSVRNRGFEVSLNAVLVEKENFGLTLGANLSINENMVTSLGGLDRIESETQWASTEIGTDYLVTVGQPLGNIYGYESDGMYTVDDFTYDGSKWVLNEGVADCSSVIGSDYLRPGAMKLKDQNGDGKVTSADKKIIGNATPKGFGGVSITGYLYGFDFSANFNYVFGNDIYNANKIEFTSSRKYRNRNLMQTGEQRWTNIDWTTGALITDKEQLREVNAGATLWSPAVGNAVLSDWAVEDGSFLRLTSATIGYTLPSQLTMKARISRLRFYVTGTNLFCLTNYSGYDPEVDTRRSTPLTPGVDYSAYPKSIGFVVGVNLTF